jgi:zinc transport system ATP-binding protein
MESLEIVDLANHANEAYLHLSGGQQQRVLIARGIVNRPAVIIMDEPFAGVDLTNQVKIAESLRGFAGTMVVVLHETMALSEILDRTLILREGRLIYDGPLTTDGHHGNHPTNPPERTHLLTGMEQTWSF